MNSICAVIATLLSNAKISVGYKGFHGWGRGPGSNGGVLFSLGEIKNFAILQTRKIFKNVEK